MLSTAFVLTSRFSKSFLKPASAKMSVAMTRASPRSDLMPLSRTLAPARDLFDMFDLFDLGPSTSLSPMFPARGSLPLDVKETPKTYELTLDLPGIEKKDIKISAQNDQLRISAHREVKRKEEGENFLRTERFSGHVSRTLNLPEDADLDNIQAENQDGILRITVPKTESQAKDVKLIEVK